MEKGMEWGGRRREEKEGKGKMKREGRAREGRESGKFALPNIFCVRP